MVYPNPLDSVEAIVSSIYNIGLNYIILLTYQKSWALVHIIMWVIIDYLVNLLLHLQFIGIFITPEIKYKYIYI